MGFSFTTVVAQEPVAARREVIDFAENLFNDQRQTWYDLRRTHQPCKSRWATRVECFEKSREIRIKRERNATYWNDTTAANPQY